MRIENIIVNDKNIVYDDECCTNMRQIMTDQNTPTEADWQERAKGLLKSELARRGIGYKGLSMKLNILGIKETDRNIANKISRGGFSAVFLIQCLTAVGCENVRLDGLGS